MTRCKTGKATFSKKEAQSEKNLAEQFGQFFRIYPCPDCNFWHLTSKTHGKRHSKNER